VEGHVTNPGVRASDDDRRRVVAALERHTAAGRLTLDEFSERVGMVFAAATHGDLAVVTRDLPPEPPAAPAMSTVLGQSTDHRQLLVAFLLAAITIAVLGVILAIAR
jgi:hypothetical protein